MRFRGDRAPFVAAARYVRVCRRWACAAAAVLVLAVLATPPIAAQEQVLVESGSSITYLANASDPGIDMAWTDPAFPDGGWDTGTYGIGYDNTGAAQNLIETTVPPDTISVYTRSVFTVADVDDIDNLWIGYDHDDGIVVWINGTEVHRSAEMPPTGPLAWDTPATPGESSNDDAPVYAPYHDISAEGIAALHDGANVLAVGVWNSWALSDDLVLVPQLLANKGLQLTRGPYLQIATPTSIRVRWRTDVFEDSRVLFGTNPQDLSSEVLDPLLVVEHDVELTGLQPETRYYYAIGNGDEILAGADLEHYFETHPLSGPPRTTRIWVLGDSGYPGPDQESVRDSYYAYAGDRYTDLWLHMGDISQSTGTDPEYQVEFFDSFTEMTRKTVIWPTLGNHDGGHANSTNLTGPYYEIFSLPAEGEAGGMASGTEAYYSFDYANMHCVVLNSHDVDRSPGGAMLTWLEVDLASTDKDWIIAYWHHPAYSKGHHDSDDPVDSGGRLRDMRENALPILEDYGVDLVLAGHSHCYERSFLLDGHYGTSDTLVESMKVDDGDGREDGDGPYLKPLRGPVPYPGPGDGAVYMTAGSGSSAFGGPLNHPVMVVSLNVVGSVVLDVDGLRLDAKFLDNTCSVPPCTSSILDYFTMIKGANCQGADADEDGECDDVDNCPNDYNPNQEDTDNDGAGDACDMCPYDPDDDIDGDGACGDVDNCPDDHNPDQDDADADGTGDVCDLCPYDPDDDIDGDGHCSNDDNCPDDYNPNQEDRDGDAIGDICDSCPDDPDNDADNDTVCGDVDNCPADPNGGQADTDADGMGNPCDPCPLDAANDADGDSFCANVDNCPGVPNDQSDADLDGIGDVCDGCPLDPDNDFDQDGYCGDVDNCPGAANDQTDTDSDGIGDACDFPDDADGDSVPDGADNCPAVSNPAQQDADGDGLGDACDDDTDGDGVADASDCAPMSPGVSAMPGEIGPTLFVEEGAGTRLHWQRAIQGPVSHVYLVVSHAGQPFSNTYTCADFGNPGTESMQPDDPLPGEFFAYVVGAANICGSGPMGNGRETPDTCPLDGSDSDGDGVGNEQDNCPLTHDPTLSDVDNDFVGDVCDNCPTMDNPAQADSDGDGQGDACADLVDQDGDGIEDDVDNCPLDWNTDQSDADQDGAGDVCDPCPYDADDDIDTDGFCADVDNCPTIPNPDQTNTDGDLLGDICDVDDDNDGVDDTADPSPLDPDVCGDADGDTCDDCAVGTDGFGPLPDNDPANDGDDFDGDGDCDQGDPDDDNDGVDDPVDSDPLNPFACRDVDGDTCDDCSSGIDAPDDDGTDTDSDGACDDGDPDDDNDGVDDMADPSPLDPDVCGDVDGDTCDDCAVGTDDYGPLPDNDPANDGPDFDGDGDCDQGDPDDDNDGVDDPVDSDPLNPFACRDVDGDTCDDCSSGIDAPDDDGTDTDSDGACDAGDPDDDNDGVDDVADPAPLDPDICGDVDGDTCDDCAVGTDDYGPLPDNDPANDGPDFDGDGDCDQGDPDDDNDGVDDPVDSDPLNPFACRDVDGDTCDDCSSGIDDPANDGDDNDGDGLCDPGDPDDDDDSIPDDDDNCPFHPNIWQLDEDGDGIGDVCDRCLGDPFNDYDNDGLCTSADNCPSVPNPEQTDEDSNGIGDACEIVPVASFYRLSATEVTNLQYAEFLNAVADSDPNELFNPNMASDPRGGIIRFPVPGGFIYSVKANMGNKPVNFVSWLDAARYVNWLHNGKPEGPQGPDTTETGAYILTLPNAGHTAVRQPGATWFLPTKHEWNVAAYGNATLLLPWLYPTRSNVAPKGATATSAGDVGNPGLNVANYDKSADWNLLDGNVTTVGSCGPLSSSYWGTYDQGGNVAEWVETLTGTANRVIRGGSYQSEEHDLRRTFDGSLDPAVERSDLGFRVATGI